MSSPLLSAERVTSMRGSVAATLATAAFSAIVALLLVLPGQLIEPDAHDRPLAAPDVGSSIRAIEATLPEAVEARGHAAAAAVAQTAAARPRQLSRPAVVRASAAPAGHGTRDRAGAPTVTARPIPVVTPARPSTPPAVAPAQPAGAEPARDGGTPVPPVPAAEPLPVVPVVPVVPVASAARQAPAAAASPIAKAIAVAHAARRAPPAVMVAIRDVAAAAQAECVDATCDKAPRAEGRPGRNSADGLRPVAAIAGEAAASVAGAGQEARDADRNDRSEARRVAVPQAREVADILAR
jgi:hypothetical protein